MVNSNSLSDIWFQLVDANMRPIKLLSPMYISAHADGYEAVSIFNNVESSKNVPPQNIE
jgi:hypothetical protein